MIKIENKFDVGQRVYFLDSAHKAHEDEVESVVTYQYKDKQRVHYCLKGSQFTSFYEEDLWPSKQEMMNYIFDHDLIDFQ